MGVLRFCRLVLLLLVCGAAAGQARAAQDALTRDLQEKLNRVAADLFSTTPHPAEAIEQLKALLAAEPTLAEGHMLLGIAYRLQGSPEVLGEAVAELRQAIALKPSLLMARLTLARVYLDMARPTRAREELEAALQEMPGRPEILSLLGEAERQLQNPRRSVDLNRQALKADPSFVQARYYLALALLDLGQRADSISEMQLVVKSGVNPVEANLGLGAALLQAGRTDEALVALREAARLDPSRPQTHLQLARLYRTKGMLETADRELELAAAGATAGLSGLYQSIEEDLYMEQGVLRIQQGRLEAAAAAFQKVLNLNSGHDAAKQRLAEVRKRLQEQASKKKAGFPL